MDTESIVLSWRVSDAARGRERYELELKGYQAPEAARAIYEVIAKREHGTSLNFQIVLGRWPELRYWLDKLGSEIETRTISESTPPRVGGNKFSFVVMKV